MDTLKAVRYCGVGIGISIPENILKDFNLDKPLECRLYDENLKQFTGNIELALSDIPLFGSDHLSVSEDGLKIIVSKRGKEILDTPGKGAIYLGKGKNLIRVLSPHYDYFNIIYKGPEDESQ